MTTERFWKTTCLLALALMPSAAFAFHEGGAATCSGCHILHESDDGLVVMAGPDLLLVDNASDLCLTCHAQAAGEVLGLDPLLPGGEKGGGNFVHLIEENLNDGIDGGLPANWIGGHRAGHNVFAPGHGLLPDAENIAAPGGSFPSDQLSCTSCHDPHGRDTFRMLYGVGPVQGGLATFIYTAPAAEGIDLQTTESNTNHTAYRAGMNDWCANCHGQFHDNGEGGQDHPFGEPLSGDERNQYNGYRGDPLPGPPPTECLPVVMQANSYLAQVPFESATSTTASTEGPAAGGAEVICLTCHRAHASSAPSAMRWDPNVALLDEDGVESGSHALANPYCSSQGSLCTKCHMGGSPAAEAEFPDAFSRLEPQFR